MLELIPEHRTTHKIHLYRDGVSVLTLRADSIAGAQSQRRDLVERLRDNPLTKIVWEDVPRPTGWYGMRPGTVETGASVYHITIESS